MPPTTDHFSRNFLDETFVILGVLSCVMARSMFVSLVQSTAPRKASASGLS
jgi:hypothetical protein